MKNLKVGDIKKFVYKVDDYNDVEWCRKVDIGVVVEKKEDYMKLFLKTGQLITLNNKELVEYKIVRLHPDLRYNLSAIYSYYSILEDIKSRLGKENSKGNTNIYHLQESYNNNRVLLDKYIDRIKRYHTDK